MPVLISSGSGSGRSEDEVLLASTLRLLARGSRPSVVALSVNVGVSELAHPGVQFRAQEQLVEALELCSTLLIVGDLGTGDRLERAALQAAQAKLAGVAVGLVAVRMPHNESMCERDLCTLLAECESVSTRDAQSARVFSECSGLRAHTAAPLELLMRVDRRRRAEDPCRVGVDAEWFASANPAMVQALVHAAATLGISLVALAPGEACTPAPGQTETLTTGSWQKWLQEISDCDLFVGRVNSVALHVAAGQGVAPIGIADRESSCDLHERLGLAELVLAPNASPSAVTEALVKGRSLRREALSARATTLRTVAWRALGPLADATRSSGLRVEALRDGAKRILARAFEARVRSALERGDFDGAARELEQWRPHLGREPRWALACAQLDILQGRERDARVQLERATASAPDDSECHATLAMVLWRLGEVDAARRAWDRVAELEPASARAPYQIGCLELLRGHMEQALHAWDEAHQRDPSHAAANRALADAAPARVRDGAA